MGEQWSYNLDGYDEVYTIPLSLTHWCADPVDAAEQAAEHYYGIDPDTEMFPLDLVMYCDGDPVGRYSVSIDWSPNFHARDVTP